jgi:hypothetical protein
MAAADPLYLRLDAVQGQHILDLVMNVEQPHVPLLCERSPECIHNTSMNS